MRERPYSLTATPDDIAYLRRLLITVVVLATLAALWLLADLLLLLLAAILFALLLRAIADPLAHRLGIGEGWGLLLATLLIALVVAVTVYLFGSRLGSQLATLTDRLPQALSGIAKELNVGNWAEMLETAGPGSTVGNLVTRMLSWSTAVIGFLASVVIIVFGGIYLAIEPRLYAAGFLKLVPPAVQPHVAATLDDCGQALSLWLRAQLAAMIVVGTLTTVGLLLVGTPSAWALGLIAGVAEAVPYIGPVAAAVPGLIIAGSQDAETMWWTLAVYVAVQQIENNLLMPLLASRSVSIPPALAIFAIMAMGVLFGPLGLLLGFPLSIVLDTAVRRLYVLDTLGEPVEILGEQAGESTAAEPMTGAPPSAG